jgi:UDP-N-acetyl-D-glucosamine dehydrogenase
VESSLGEALDSGNFKPTGNIDKIADCSIYLICVPTPIDTNHDPDFELLEQSIRDIVPLVQKVI